MTLMTFDKPNPEPEENTIPEPKPVSPRVKEKGKYIDRRRGHSLVGGEGKEPLWMQDNQLYDPATGRLVEDGENT